MELVNMHAAKTQLSKPVQRAASGETILIGRWGRALAQLAPLPETDGRHRLGFLEGAARIAEDFDTMGDDQIRDDFGVA